MTRRGSLGRLGPVTLTNKHSTFLAHKARGNYVAGTCPPLSPSPREQLYNRSCSNQHTLDTHLNLNIMIQLGVGASRADSKVYLQVSYPRRPPLISFSEMVDVLLINAPRLFLQNKLPPPVFFSQKKGKGGGKNTIYCSIRGLHHTENC